MTSPFHRHLLSNNRFLLLGMSFYKRRPFINVWATFLAAFLFIHRLLFIESFFGAEGLSCLFWLNLDDGGIDFSFFFSLVEKCVFCCSFDQVQQRRRGVVSPFPLLWVISWRDYDSIRPKFFKSFRVAPFLGKCQLSGFEERPEEKTKSLSFLSIAFYFFNRNQK